MLLLKTPSSGSKVWRKIKSLMIFLHFVPLCSLQCHKKTWSGNAKFWDDIMIGWWATCTGENWFWSWPSPIIFQEIKLSDSKRVSELLQPMRCFQLLKLESNLRKKNNEIITFLHRFHSAQENKPGLVYFLGIVGTWIFVSVATKHHFYGKIFAISHRFFFVKVKPILYC